MKLFEQKSAARALTLVALLLVYSVAGHTQPTFTISTVAGNGMAGFSGDGGPALNGSMNDPRGVVVDASGNVYVADLGNSRVRKVAPNGTITTIAGNGIQGFSGDGGAATSAELNQPIRVEVDALGNLYIADAGNSRIRRVAPGGTITTIAGNGTKASAGDGGAATSASLNYPNDAVPDAAGNLFISEGADIRKVDTHGIITTVAGNGISGYSGDGGPATQASLDNPNALTIDSAGNLFISDQFNNRIRKVTGGVITTVAGNGVQGYAGDKGSATAAELNDPVGTALDIAGNLYIADAGNNRIRVVLSDGTIMTVAGNGSGGYSGDGGSATAAALDGPHTLARSPSGGFYFADDVNQRIRLLAPVLQIPSIGGAVSASAFGGFASISPGSWIEIYGSNLAIDSRSWGGSDFQGTSAPTSLDGTSVAIGGQSAFIDFISPAQVNVLVPSNVGVGLQQITVKDAAGVSVPFTITVNAVQPGMLSPPSFDVSGIQYAVALFADGTYVLPSGAIPGLTSRPARSGDTIVLYGVGFGPVVPAIPAGQLVQQSNGLASRFQVSVGGIPATTIYSGLAPDFTGLYQFNLVVPNVAASNAVPLTFIVGGVAGTQTLYIAVQD